MTVHLQRHDHDTASRTAAQRVREALAAGGLPTPGDVLTVTLQAEALWINDPHAARCVERRIP